mmetsp:Transcript_13591/g.39631  ORF Transcript_13591/g.39631 Transcript_13591/m.39631 type:complete len:429 (+) Transcript_13591:118-1404(+)
MGQVVHRDAVGGVIPNTPPKWRAVRRGFRRVHEIRGGAPRVRYALWAAGTRAGVIGIGVRTVRGVAGGAAAPATGGFGRGFFGGAGEVHTRVSEAGTGGARGKGQDQPKGALAEQFVQRSGSDSAHAPPARVDGSASGRGGADVLVSRNTALGCVPHRVAPHKELADPTADVWAWEIREVVPRGCSQGHSGTAAFVLVVIIAFGEKVPSLFKGWKPILPRICSVFFRKVAVQQASSSSSSSSSGIKFQISNLSSAQTPRQVVGEITLYLNSFLPALTPSVPQRVRYGHDDDAARGHQPRQPPPMGRVDTPGGQGLPALTGEGGRADVLGRGPPCAHSRARTWTRAGRLVRVLQPRGRSEAAGKALAPRRLQEELGRLHHGNWAHALAAVHPSEEEHLGKGPVGNAVVVLAVDNVLVAAIAFLFGLSIA